MSSAPHAIRKIMKEKMTWHQFVKYLKAAGIKWQEIKPCHCKDTNCKGWRITKY